jgi:hypothetical protein
MCWQNLYNIGSNDSPVHRLPSIFPPIIRARPAMDMLNRLSVRFRSH